jgi:hypothetical protein
MHQSYSNGYVGLQQITLPNTKYIVYDKCRKNEQKVFVL